jgi:hypothetical protein
MTNAKTQFIIWNGCDGEDYASEGDEIFTKSEKFTAFQVAEVALKSLPIIDESTGERDFDGHYMTPDYKVWKAV